MGEFRERYGVSINILDYFSLCSSVPLTWVSEIKNGMNFEEQSSVLEEVLTLKNTTCNQVYMKLILGENKILQKKEK